MTDIKKEFELTENESIEVFYCEHKEQLIEDRAQELHKIQVESAKLNDTHTEGISILYLEWNELHQEMKDWYIAKAKQILLGHGLYMKVMKPGRKEGDNYNDPTDSLYEFIPLQG